MFEPLDKGTAEFVPDGTAVMAWPRNDPAQSFINHSVGMSHLAAFDLIRYTLAKHCSLWSISASAYTRGVPTKDDPLGQRPGGPTNLFVSFHRLADGQRRHYVSFENKETVCLDTPTEVVDKLRALYARVTVETP